jgi:metal-responsive CopG/Arc/MetJ family transcriptional regulator
VKNVQISFDEDLLNEVNNMVASTRLSRSAIVREALRRWIREKKTKKFEDEWIKKLKENPDDTQEANAWIKIEQWGD